ncbi:MAG: DEAD/DEAH box helicase family protein [Magnetococcales bacterium]|nr:DEAD/DEAH box helicase family protein [Magnetococcales bacterium]
MLILRPYQRYGIDAIYAYFQENTGNCLIVIPTAGGKSLVMAKFIQEAITLYPETRILVVTHVRELISQNYAELIGLWPEAPAGIHSAGLGCRDTESQVLFCGIQSVHKRAYDIQRADLVLVDECFVTGTSVSTPTGSCPIEFLQLGDSVLHALGVGNVLAIRKTLSDNIWIVRLNNGEKIVCTGNHQFFTKSGWVAASQLECGTRLYRDEDLQTLRGYIPTMDQMGRYGKSDFHYEGKSLEKAEVLLDFLLKEVRKPDAQSGNPTANGDNFEEDRTSSDKARRQWNGSNDTTSGNIGGTWCGVDCGTGYSDKDCQGEWLSNVLQTRSRQPEFDDRNRTGGGHSLWSEKRTGQQEGCSSGVVWVESISRSEQSRPQVVYNLQVSGHPSFFAQGVLVHNCHLIPRTSNTMYRRFLDDLKIINPALKIIGFTATPYRLDSGMLHKGEDALFDDIAYEISVRDLVDQGYLSPLISKQTDTQLDVTGVGTRGGEFIAGQLEQAVDKDPITQAAVEEIVAFGQDRQSWLLFCSGVAHAEHVRDAIQARGFSCECIFGSTPQGERDSIIAAFKQGQIRALAAMNVLTTGFNAPGVDLIAMLRPTKSTGLYVQIAGRGTRLAPGKVNCLVLDFAGNVARHGPIDLVKPPSKGKGDGEAPIKVCPICDTINHAAVRVCIQCGYKFPPPETQIDTTATTKEILTNGKPEWVSVYDVVYHRHEKEGKPPSMRVEYVCGMNSHREWVCFEHTGYARQNAARWWSRRAPPGMPMPKTVEDALAQQDVLRMPSHIAVRKSGRFAEVVDAKFEEVNHGRSNTP